MENGQGIQSVIKFRFSLILLCVVLPPVLYITTIQFLESHAQNRLRAALESAYLGDTRLLLDGTLAIERVIPANIEHTLSRSRWLAWGGKADVTVRTGGNILLYPSNYQALQAGGDLKSTPLDTATENYELITQGLELSLVFKLPHNTILANLVLGFYILCSLSGLLIYYGHWNSLYRRENKRRADELAHLAESERSNRSQLDALKLEHTRLIAEISQMQNQLSAEKEKSNASEEEMLEAMLTMEATIAHREAALKQQLETLNDLQEKLARLETPRQKDTARRAKQTDMARKRLDTLYKNLEIGERAVEGYLDLTEELKIKAEEVMLQLNENPAAVQIKRKVFGKKNRLTVLEVVFGYKGRLYFRVKAERQAELLAIGTKNSQSQDLAFLERL